MARKAAYPEHMGHDFLPHFRALVKTSRTPPRPWLLELVKHVKSLNFHSSGWMFDYVHIIP